MKSIYFLLSMWIFFPICMFSQTSISATVPNVVSKTPDAASMAKFVSCPIDYCVGQAKISIPLYEIKVGDITLPISLSYNSSGLRPKEISGRVGTGWVLTAEPSVARTVNGLPDDYLTGGLNPDTGYEYTQVSENYRPNDYLRALFEGRHDEQPDEYSYQLINNGGRCFTPFYRSLKVSVPYNTLYVTPHQIIDNDGYKYYFGGSSASRELTGITVTRWMCDSITSSKTKAKISFDYNEIPRFNSSLYTCNQCVTIEDGNLDGSINVSMPRDGYTTNYSLLGDSNLVNANMSYNYKPSSSLFQSNSFSARDLNAIYFDNGSIQFEYDIDASSITQLQVKNKDNYIIRTIDFYVSKYNSDTDLEKLDSLAISAPGCERQVYRMEYINTHEVPGSDTYLIDHWGYNNGLKYDKYTNPHGAIPKMTIQCLGAAGRTFACKIGHIDRDPIGYYAENGLLCMMTDPHNIRTTFEYEPNKTAYADSESYTYNEHQVGGVRVFNIIEYDPKSGIHKRRYIQYASADGIDSSIIGYRPGVGAIKMYPKKEIDYCYSQDVIHDFIDSDSHSIYKRYRLRVFSATPYTGLTFFNGNVVYYNYVTETVSADNGPTIMTKYFYKTPHLIPETRAFDWKRRTIDVPFSVDNLDPSVRDQGFKEAGQLLRVENYRNDSIVSQTKYEYVVKNDVMIPEIRVAKPYQTLIYHSDDVARVAQNSQYKECVWSQGNGWLALDKTITTEFDKTGTPIEVTKQFYYGNDGFTQNPIRTETLTSSGELVKNVSTFANYELENFQENISGSLYESHISNAPIEEKSIVGNDTTYIRAVYAGNRLSLVKKKSEVGNKFYPAVNYHQYSDYGNVAEISSENQIHVCYIWSYNNQYPIAKIENSTISEILNVLQKDNNWLINLGNKDRPSDDDYVTINSIRGKLPNSMVYSYEYSPLLGMISSTDPRGVKSRFDYDAYGRLTESYIMRNNLSVPINRYKYKF